MKQELSLSLCLVLRKGTCNEVQFSRLFNLAALHGPIPFPFHSNFSFFTTPSSHSGLSPFHFSKG